MLAVVGIDLAGKPSKPTGWALLRGGELTVKTLFSDGELCRETHGAHPRVVAIDAPLTLPKAGATRLVERVMHRRGYPVLPPLYPAMRVLTERGIRLAEELRGLGMEVIEVHPASSLKALFLPKRRGEVVKALIGAGLRGLNAKATAHEVDATIAAVTALFYLEGLFEKVGDEEEGYIILPTGRLSEGILGRA